MAPGRGKHPERQRLNGCHVHPETPEVRTRICRQPIKSSPKNHDWSVEDNYCQEPTRDRKCGAAVETMSTIIANNRSNSFLEGAVDTLTVVDLYFQRSQADAGRSSHPAAHLSREGLGVRFSMHRHPSSSKSMGESRHFLPLPLTKLWLLFSQGFSTPRAPGGLSPPKSLPASFRLTVISASYGAMRHVWRTHEKGPAAFSRTRSRLLLSADEVLTTHSRFWNSSSLGDGPRSIAGTTAIPSGRLYA